MLKLLYILLRKTIANVIGYENPSSYSNPCVCTTCKTRRDVFTHTAIRGVFPQKSVIRGAPRTGKPYRAVIRLFLSIFACNMRRFRSVCDLSCFFTQLLELHVCVNTHQHVRTNKNKITTKSTTTK